MYAKIDTDDEGDVTIRKVVEHIRAVEAGSGNNDWVEAETRFNLIKLAEGEPETGRPRDGSETQHSRGAGGVPGDAG